MSFFTADAKSAERNIIVQSREGGIESRQGGTKYSPEGSQSLLIDGSSPAINKSHSLRSLRLCGENSFLKKQNGYIFKTGGGGKCASIVRNLAVRISGT